MSNIGAIVGGTGAVVDNGIFFNSDVITANQNQSVVDTGTAIKRDTGVTYTNGTTLFEKAGLGTDALVGMYAFISGTNITSGYYEITARAAGSITCANIVASGDNADSVVNIGGACPITGGGGVAGDFDLQDVLDSTPGSAAANNVDIYTVGTGTLTASLNIAVGGSATTVKTLVGANTSYVVDGTRAILTTGVSLATGLIAIDSGASSVTFRNLDLDANGVGKGDYGIYNNTDAEESIVIKNCLIHDADINGVQHGGSTVGDEWAIIGCEIYDNRGSGIRARSTARGVVYVVGCDIHNNTVYGIYGGNYTRAHKNTIYNNGDSGIFNSNASTLPKSFIGNTIYSNGGDGFESVASSELIVIANNTSVGNDGFGFNLAGMAIGEVMVFSNNHSKDNDFDGSKDSGASHCSETATLAIFVTFGQGNNLSGDPAFTNVGSGTEDFRPGSSSVLIDAGLGGTGDTVGALSAVAGGGGGGGIIGVSWN